MANKRNDRLPAPKSAEYYRRHRQKLVDKGTVKKLHADSTKNNIRNLIKKWTRFCEMMGEDRLLFLARAGKEDIMTFLKWILNEYRRLKKKSTLHEYWRQWCMLYRKSVGKSLHANVMEQVNDYIKQLAKEHGLDLTVREKPVMNVDDIYNALCYLWGPDTSIFPDERQRLQLALSILVMAYTGTRPSAIVFKKPYQKKDRENPIGEENDESDSDMDGDSSSLVNNLKTLCYGDVEITMLPDPGAERDKLTAELTLRYTKGHQMKPNPKTFILTEVDDLIFDPIILLITNGILDNAFDAEYTSMEQVLKTRVRAPRKSLDLRWKPEFQNVPIFRGCERVGIHLRTSSQKPLLYHTHLYYLQRLGVQMGMMNLIGGYNIRRGTGESVEGVATQPQLQQVMSHRDAGVYQAYINQRVQCDVQAAFLGRPSSDAIFRAVSHMSRHCDPRAPTSITAEQSQSLKSLPNIVQLRTNRDLLSREAREEFGTLKEAEKQGSKLFELYKKASDRFQAAKVRALKNATREAREEYFDSISTREIRKQFDASFLDIGEEWQAPMVQHTLEERTIVADLISKDPDNLSDGEKIQHRLATVNALVELCQKREHPAQPALDRDWGIAREDASRDTFKVPLRCSNMQCLFCFWSVDEPECSRFRQYATVYKTRDHVERHLKAYDLSSAIPCPDPGCQERGIMLQGHMHFKNHAALQHDYDIFRRNNYA